MPDGLIVPYRPEVSRKQSLWLPPDASGRRGPFGQCPDAADHEMIAFKLLIPEHGYQGQVIHAPRDFDVDAPGHDGKTLRDQIHLQMTGLYELATGGEWLWQDSDEMQGRIYMERIPERDYCEERWNEFLRRVPTHRDSMQDV